MDSSGPTPCRPAVDARAGWRAADVPVRGGAELPAHHVARPRLVRLLDAGDPALRLVAARAGAGASVLVHEWAAAHPRLRVTWSEPGAGCDQALADVAAHLCTADEHDVLVLDDVRDVTDQSLTRLIALVDEPTARGHVVVTTRGELPWQRAHARATASGLVNEVGTADLRATPTEARQLLARLVRRPFDAVVAEQLIAVADGWMAALVLAARSLDPDDDGARFGAHGDSVAQLLQRAVFDGMRPATRRALLAIACLDEVTPDLCHALTGRERCDELVEELQRHGVFGADAPDGIRHLHPLLLERLRSELDARHLRARAAHARAARWYSGEGDWSAALQHADAAGDVDVLLDLLQRHRRPLQRSGRFGDVVRRVAAIPEPSLLAPPTRALQAAWSFATAFAPERATPLAAHAARHLGPQAVAGLAETIAASAAIKAGGLHADDGPLWHLTTIEEPVDPMVGASVLVWRTRLAAMADRFDDAQVALRALGVHVRDGLVDGVVLDGLVAHVAVLQGDLRGGAAAVDAVVAACARREPDASVLVDVLIARAALHLERGDIERATATVDEAERTRAAVRLPYYAGMTTLMRAEIVRASGAPGAAARMVEDRILASSIARESPLRQRAVDSVVRALLDVGDVRRAERALAGVTAEQTLLRLRTRIDLARGDHAAARWAVGRLRPTAPRRELEIELLAARAWCDQRDVARQHVARALDLAALHGFTWVLAREPQVQELAAEVAPASRFAALDQLAPPRTDEPPGQLADVVERVSARELMVLRLLASHLSTREIATSLAVTPNTVKSHVKSVYRKLGVASRSDAVDVARRCGLIPRPVELVAARA